MHVATVPCTDIDIYRDSYGRNFSPTKVVCKFNINSCCRKTLHGKDDCLSLCNTRGCNEICTGTCHLVFIIFAYRSTDMNTDISFDGNLYASSTRTIFSCFGLNRKYRKRIPYRKFFNARQIVNSPHRKTDIFRV